MQVVDANGNVFGQGLEITGIDGKPKVPVINTDITIGTTAIIGGVSGRLLFDNAGVVGETAGINWSPSTSTLSLFDSPFVSQAGNSSANTSFSITGTASSNYTIYSSRQFIFNTGQSMYFNTDTDGGSALDRAWYFAGARTGMTGGRTYGALTVDSSGFPSFILYNNDNGARILLNSNATSYFNGGNLLIGTTTDAGYKLDVNGSARVVNDITTNSTFIATNSSLSGSTKYFSIVRSTDGNNPYYVTSDRVYMHGVFFQLGGQGSGSIYSGNSIGNATTYITLSGPAYYNPTSGTAGIFAVSGQSFMSSGTATFNTLTVSPIINNTGTYSGIFRGFYYNPTRTSLTGTTHRAIETTSGDVIFNGGNVGIGTASPLDFNLVVQGVQQIRASASSFGGLRLDATSIRRRDTGTFSLGTNDSSTAINMFAPTNNVGINTTTDAGFRLDVNGTGRFSGSLTINNDMVINSVGDRSITWAVNDLRFMVGTNNIARFFTTGTVFISTVGVATTTGTSVGPSMAGITASSATFSATFFANPQVNHLQTKMLIGGNDGAYGGNTTQGIGLWIYGGNNTTNNSYGNVVIAHDGTIARGNVLIGTSTNVSSAIVNVSSTTKGFLPPRMTNTEMLAIATPSAGLIVYDTTNNKHYGYDGTTWNPFY